MTWILFFLSVFAAIAAFLDAARYMGWISYAALGPLEFFIEDTQWLGAIFAVLLGVVWIVVAGWLWSQDTRGWMFVVIIAALNLFFVALSLFGTATFENIWPAVLINGLVLLLAFLPSTRTAFGADPDQY